MENKQINEQESIYPPKEFKSLSAEETLKWLEQSSQFVKTFLSNEDIIKWRRIKNENTSNRV